MTREDLKRLCDAANAICDEAQGKYETDGYDAVNWADLSCVEARWVRTDWGDEWAEVLIEEVAPGQVRFSTWIAQRLAERGFPDVRVLTEW